MHAVLYEPIRVFSPPLRRNTTLAFVPQSNHHLASREFVMPPHPRTRRLVLTELTFNEYARFLPTRDRLIVHTRSIVEHAVLPSGPALLRALHFMYLLHVRPQISPPNPFLAGLTLVGTTCF